MARPREFDIDTAIAGAMQVFWQYGYEGASLPQLLRGMKITRGSLYKAFTDKKALFLAVMEHYEQEAVTTAVHMLSTQAHDDGITRIEKLFNAVVDTVKKGDRRGCLLCSAAAGPATHDVEISETVHELLNKMKQGFKTAIDEASLYQQTTEKDKDHLADLLLTHYVGLRIFARSHAPPEMLEHSCRAIITLMQQQR